MHRSRSWWVLLMIMLSGCQIIWRENEQHYDQPWPVNRLLLVTVDDDGQIPFAQRGYPAARYFLLSPQVDAQLAAIERRYPLERVDGWPIKPLGVYCFVLEVKEGADPEVTLAKIRQDPSIRIAQPLHNFEVLARDLSGPDKDYFSLQYGDNADRVRRWHQQATGVGVRIAVIDTGIDRKHPNLHSRIAFSDNFVGDKTFDSDIHGTAVAGIIAASVASNGATGLAPDASLLALKACWPQQPDALPAHCNSFTLAKAVTSALERHADIINLSLSGPRDALLASLLNIALRQHVLVIAAQHAADDFPASLPGVIAVSEGQAHGQIAWVTQGTLHVEAEAEDLLSTRPGGGFDFFSGSSMATARISGLAALIRQHQPSLTAGDAMQGIALLQQMPFTQNGLSTMVETYPMAKHNDGSSTRNW